MSDWKLLVGENFGLPMKQMASMMGGPETCWYHGLFRQVVQGHKGGQQCTEALRVPRVLQCFCYRDEGYSGVHGRLLNQQDVCNDLRLSTRRPGMNYMEIYWFGWINPISPSLDYFFYPAIRRIGQKDVPWVVSARHCIWMGKPSRQSLRQGHGK